MLNYGMKRDFNKWLASLGPAAPVKTLTELREWNTAHERLGAIKYGQAQLDISDEMDLEKDRATYEEDRAQDIRVCGTNGIDAAMKANNLDALLFPGPASAAIASQARISDRDRAVRHDSQSRERRPERARGSAGRRGPRRATRPVAGEAAAPTRRCPLPAGFDPKPQPFGVGFTGTACSEPKLLQLAYAFEQATKKRTPPPGLR